MARTIHYKLANNSYVVVLHDTEKYCRELMTRKIICFFHLASIFKRNSWPIFTFLYSIEPGCG